MQKVTFKSYAALRSGCLCGGTHYEAFTPIPGQQGHGGRIIHNGINASTCSLCRHSASSSVTNFNSIESLIPCTSSTQKNRTKHSLSSAIIPIYDVIYIKHITYILVLCTRLIDLPAISQCINLAKLITQYVYNTCTYNVLNVSSDSFVCSPCNFGDKYTIHILLRQ